MQDEYLNYLYEQFKSATGAEKVDSFSKSFSDEFAEWIYERKIGSECYLKLLDFIKINYDDENTAEVGKSKLDSLFCDRFATSIITPYTDGMNKRKSFLLKGEFIVSNGNPMLLRPNKKNFREISFEGVKTYMTHNPYTDHQIANWYQLHNFSQNSIAVGVFGKIYDKDSIEKVEHLRKKLKNNLSDNFIEEDYIDKDNYAYIIASKKKEQKQLKKVRY